MTTRTWLTLTLALGLTACTAPTHPTTPDPVPPADVTSRFDTKADLQAFAANLYSQDPVRRQAQVAAYVRATQATPAPAAQGISSLPDNIQELLTVDERELLNLQRGLDTSGGLTLDGWAAQATAFGFRSAQGGNLTADVIRSTLQAIAAQDTFSAEQRPLAIVAALWAARTDASTDGFGDGVLDPMQVLIMNNVLMASLLEAQTLGTQQVASQDEGADGLKLFNDAYNTGKQLLSDVGTVLTGVKEFGAFGDCAMFLVNSIEMNLTADRAALWRQGNDGPFQAKLTAKASLRGDIKDEDLIYYAQHGCAPSANRTFEKIQTRWLLSSAKNGTLSASGGPTDAQGTFVNTFTTTQDTSRMIERTPENKRTDAVTAKVLVSHLSATYPHLEWRLISSKMSGSTNLGRELKLNVSYYEPQPVQWRLNFTTVTQSDGPVLVASNQHHDEWFETTTGEVLFELDPERSGQYSQYLTPVGGSFSVTHRAQVCSVEWPELVNYPLAPYMEWGVLVFTATEDPTVTEYLMNLGTLDQSEVKVSYTCPHDSMTYTEERPKFPNNVAKVGDVMSKDYPTFDPTRGVSSLSGTYTYRTPYSDDVTTTQYTLTRVQP